MDGEAGQAIVHVVARSWTRLSNFHFQFLFIQTYEGIIEFSHSKDELKFTYFQFSQFQIARMQLGNFSPLTALDRGRQQSAEPQESSAVVPKFLQCTS